MNSYINRPFNFSAGPGTLPLNVLERIEQDLFNWNDSGMSVMEMSHRGAEFTSIHNSAITKLRKLMDIPENFSVLFTQGGGVGQNALIPMNLSNGKDIDFVVSGNWSLKSSQEATKYSNRVNIIANSRESNYTNIPDISTWRVTKDTSYLHICSNETIQGVQYQKIPSIAELGSDIPLVLDCSSDIASRRIEWNNVGLVFAAAQKNLGIAGLTIVIIRNDLLGRSTAICPSAFNYQLLSKNNSMFNTPPTWSIYVLELMVTWMLNQQDGANRGLQAIEAKNRRKAQRLYDVIDQSSLYINHVNRDVRSMMNIPFFLREESLTSRFLSYANQRGLLQLKGHKSVGGVRASLYNAMTEEGVDALATFMIDFENSR
jgi:phosphoserine aminotransferase